MALTDTKIRKMGNTGEAQIINDSQGLFLHIGAGKSDEPVRRATWVCRLTRQGKTQKSSIGHWPQMNVERARRERDRLTGHNIDLAVTVTEAVDDYRHLVTDRLKSGFQSEVYLRHFVAHLGNRRVATLSRAELVTLVKRYASERGVRSSDRFLTQIRGVLNLSVEHGYIEVSPLFGVSSRITGYKPTSRSRVLSADEIRGLWAWEHRNSALLRFLLLTGLRISEAQKGHQDGDRWIVPAHHSKTAKPHWVHLTETAKAQLHTPFEVSPTSVQAWIKRKQPEGSRWTPHDCRRTASTLMHDNGVDAYIVERAIGHQLQGMLRVYNRAEYEKERIEAAKILERVVLEIVAPEVTNKAGKAL